MQWRPFAVMALALSLAIIERGQADVVAQTSPAPAVQAATGGPAPWQAETLTKYCIRCHNRNVSSGGLNLATLDVTQVGRDAATWEKVVRKMRAGLMPPAGAPRPDESSYDKFRSWLHQELDRYALNNPNPGQTEAVHRLNRTEYHNAIRDLLALDIEVADMLPADDSSYGFDNIAGILRTSPSLLERYLTAARTISRLAVGGALPGVDVKNYRMAPDAQQHARMEGQPFGTRGGMLVSHYFPKNGEYMVRVDVRGANSVAKPQKFEITLNGRRVQLFELTPRPRGAANAQDDYMMASGPKFEVRVPVSAGAAEVGATFHRTTPDLLERVREPFENPGVSGNDGGPGGSLPVVTSMTITGPFADAGAGDTPSRRRLLVCKPAKATEEAACAKAIITKLATRAYRGMGTPQDTQVLMDFYTKARTGGGTFEEGVEAALRRALVDPLFLFRIENPQIPAAAATRQAATAQTPPIVKFNDLELASRLSFFLWSSIPDDELLDLAARRRLSDPAVLEQQVKRLIADPRSEALTTNFAAQWLLIRNVDMMRPGEPYLLAFDETLRQAFKTETELFFDSVVRENRSVIDLLTARYTFVNERLARHYGIPNIAGTHFRRIALAEDSPRGGILGQGSILLLTSHAIRTSPVIRGKWILNNVLGTPPPDPPPNVPALIDKKTQAKTQSMRERTAQHRANPVCAPCHNMIDPAGFALENFDAIGRYRTVDESFNAIDASGVLPDGSKFNGILEFRKALAAQPERFTSTVAERLLTYALGRGLDYYDMPAVRKIVQDSAADGYKFQSLILGVVKSFPFTNRGGTPPSAVAAHN